MTKQEIIKETAEFYNSKNRGYSEATKSCVYFDKQTGNQCGVGRCLVEPEKIGDQFLSIKNAYNEKVITNESFKPEYQNHEIDFWFNLQAFHDNSFNWDENGLTESGKAEYQNLMDEYK